MYRSLDVAQVMDDQPVSELSVRMSSDQKMPADCIRVKPRNDYSRSFIQCTRLWRFPSVSETFFHVAFDLTRRMKELNVKLVFKGVRVMMLAWVPPADSVRPTAMREIHHDSNWC